jgi:hypothetical protein
MTRAVEREVTCDSYLQHFTFDVEFLELRLDEHLRMFSRAASG